MQKETLKNATDTQQREITNQKNEIELLKKELSRLTLLLTEKESEIQSFKKASEDIVKEHQGSIKSKNEAIEDLKKVLSVL